MFYISTAVVFIVTSHICEENPEESGDYYEGDILPQRPTGKIGVFNNTKRWVNGTVPYLFANNFISRKQIITYAMKILNDVTNGCIRFVERTNERDFIYIIPTGGCGSHIGRIGKGQILSLEDFCFTKFGSILHELNHVLGAHHEHLRHDRDEYVYINFSNVLKGKEQYFNKKSEEEFSTFGLPYDYLSIMHYSSTVLSKNGKRTIQAKNKKFCFKIGQRDYLSEGDVEKIKIMYNC